MPRITDDIVGLPVPEFYRRTAWTTPEPSDIGRGVSMNGMAVVLRRVTYDGAGVRIDAIVAERDTGRPIDLTLTNEVPHPSSADEMRFFVKQTLLKFFEHEIDELLLVYGQRKDPHR